MNLLWFLTTTCILLLTSRCCWRLHLIRLSFVSYVINFCLDMARYFTLIHVASVSILRWLSRFSSALLSTIVCFEHLPLNSTIIHKACWFQFHFGLSWCLNLFTALILTPFWKDSQWARLFHLESCVPVWLVLRESLVQLFCFDNCRTRRWIFELSWLGWITSKAAADMCTSYFFLICHLHCIIFPNLWRIWWSWTSRVHLWLKRCPWLTCFSLHHIMRLWKKRIILLLCFWMMIELWRARSQRSTILSVSELLCSIHTISHSLSWIWKIFHLIRAASLDHSYICDWSTRLGNRVGSIDKIIDFIIQHARIVPEKHFHSFKCFHWFLALPLWFSTSSIYFFLNCLCIEFLF